MHTPIRFLIAILSAIVLAVAPGCGTTSVERQSNQTIAASNIAVDTALQVFYRNYALQEQKNEATRATDPGGYLERNQALLLKHGKVTVAHEKYKAAVRLTVNEWIRLHEAAQPGVPLNFDNGQIPASTAVLSAQAQLLSLAK